MTKEHSDTSNGAPVVAMTNTENMDDGSVEFTLSSAIVEQIVLCRNLYA